MNEQAKQEMQQAAETVAKRTSREALQQAIQDYVNEINATDHANASINAEGTVNIEITDERGFANCSETILNFAQLAIAIDAMQLQQA